jgi:hypothetical protein
MRDSLSSSPLVNPLDSPLERREQEYQSPHRDGTHAAANARLQQLPNVSSQFFTAYSRFIEEP